MANIYYSGTSCIDDSPIELISVEGLLTGKTYQDINLNCISLDFSASTTGETNTTFVYGPFDDCTECNSPFSAGTESQVCLAHYDCDGNMVNTSINAPHPTYTNELGKAVVQLNAIALGGINGLNN